ncbi:hypothetical protein KY285_000301 [Solanum tuberosum]|nr:hypothetical protein KY284_000340 [Solanum tuberosum]KAH0764430.1 hypothetical protein KY285_000301 [Solanum tuberosum]
MQCVPPIYVTQAQTSVTLTPIVNPYELLEKEWKSKEEERDKEMRELREEVRNMRISKRGDKLEYEDLCVHPDIDLLDGYKPPKFEMFDGTGNPRNHLRSYCDKLVGVGRMRCKNEVVYQKPNWRCINLVYRARSKDLAQLEQYGRGFHGKVQVQH